MSKSSQDLSKFPIFKDSRGQLGVISLDELPFVPKRFFWIFENHSKLSRAGHAHRVCSQYLVCLSGLVSISYFRNVENITTADLTPGSAQLLPPLTWLEITNMSADAVLGVWADQPYDDAEYIHSINEFI